MTAAQMAGYMSPGLLKVVERAKRDPNAGFNALAHLIDISALARCSAMSEKHGGRTAYAQKRIAVSRDGQKTFDMSDKAQVTAFLEEWRTIPSEMILTNSSR